MSDEKINDAKEKAQAVVEETAQKAKNIFKRFVEKLDEYYNKLPLDKINEKLGGKIDVKNPMLKRGISITFIVLIVAIVYICFRSNDPVIPVSQIEYREAFLKMSKNTFVKYGAVLLVNKKNNKTIPEKRGQETFEEYIARCVKDFSKEDLELYNKYIDQNKKNYKNEIAALEASVKLEKEREKRRKLLAQKAPELLNKAFDESYDTCTKVEVGNCFYVQKPHNNIHTTTEWYNGTAFIYNSKTGKTRERSIEMWINLDDGTMYAGMNK